ncbi:hypothetical protein AC1031_000259 [Aphanomyces cochlioides]|nr:hypothetical protein AC1031_000259 [Aphanomyces cochlioides]
MMSKRKLDLKASRGRKSAKLDVGRIPITAFFERINRPQVTPTNLPSSALVSGVSAAVDEIEDIADDADHNNVTSASTSSLAPPPPMAQSTLHFETEAKKTTRKRPNSGLHIRQLREIHGRVPHRHFQRLLRDVLSSYTTLSVTLMANLLPNQWISCMQFDTDGVLLVTGSSDGTVALYDFDVYFHRLVWLQNQSSKALNPVLSSKLHVEPVHVMRTSREIKRIRWNPMNQDEIACSFTSKNEIYLFNLKKFPQAPYRILKAPSRPSTGYYDILFTRSKINAPCIVAGDIDGSIRMWDVHVPGKPQWVISNTREVGSINSICLSANHQYLICATDKSWILVYDMWNIVVPAFGQRPVPKRLAMYALIPMIQVSSQLKETVGGIISIQLMPDTSWTVVCQLLNDWIIVLDVLCPKIYKVHCVLRGQVLKNLPSDARTFSAGELLPDWNFDGMLSRGEASYVRLHRCMGSFLFDGDIFATGFAGDKHLYAIDMRAIPDANNTQPGGITSSSVHSLQRLRLPMSEMVTAVAAHPTSHLIVCGMESNALAIVGPSYQS